MIWQEEGLSREDVATLGHLHLETLPASLVTKLGFAYAESFYRYIARSKQEVLFIFRLDSRGPIAGACALSIAPATLERRLTVGSCLIPALAVRPLVLLDCFLSRAEPPRSLAAIGRSLPSDLAGCPEVVAIFTARSVRGRGVGASLLGAVESYLREKELSRYYVKTIDAPDNHAVQFYLDNGFLLRARYSKYRKVFQIFDKTISDVPPRL